MFREYNICRFLGEEKRDHKGLRVLQLCDYLFISLLRAKEFNCLNQDSQDDGLEL